LRFAVRPYAVNRPPGIGLGETSGDPMTRGAAEALRVSARPLSIFDATFQ
jgi:hypothetical protein